MAKPIISIIIVNYNAGQFLRQCLRSIAEQSLTSYEVIVVDNASSDGSLAQANELPNAIVVRNDRNLGFAAAQNQGMASASGRFLMPLNFDIVMSPGFLGEMLRAIESSPRVGAVCGKMLQIKPDGGLSDVIDSAGLLMSRRRMPVRRGHGDIDQGQYQRRTLVFGAMGAAALYRREMLEDIAYQGQFFDESFFTWYEDVDLDWRARLRGWECLYTPSAVAYHVGDPHGHGKSRFGVRTTIRNRWSMILADECAHCFVRGLPYFVAEEVALLKHVIQRRLLTEYVRALSSFLAMLPATLRKRRRVRGRAIMRCLPDYPLDWEE